MGGKTKQSQRTKNNARPSSSSRSAELLNTSVSLDGGLVTRTGVALPALFPTLATANLDQALNPEFQICIKKLNKKDPITRTKALQELCELVNNGNVDDVEAALPSWSHCYKSLTADTDRKVREMTQVCHGAMARAVGRRLAPQLKALLPAWLQAQYDEHAPAQTSAQNSLKNTFPDSKLPEVISFCKVEVMAHFVDNLIGNTEAIIAKKIENPEERELQMCRIITSSLRGLEYFTPNLPAAHHDWLWEELTPLLEANAFWKFASSTTSVRAAWFGAMSRIIERYKGQFGDKYGLKSMRLLLNVARESNALVAAQIWTCLLQFMHHIQDWHKYLDKKELLIKRILDVLETGGWGDARHLSIVLLPLLANLPQDILTKDFYEAFFNAIYKGLDQKNIISSKSERQSWITSLAECLRYMSIQPNDFVVEVATCVHRTWLEKVLSTHIDGQTRNNLIKCSATNMSSLVKYWLKQSKEGNGEKYDQLLRNFWQNIGATIVSQIDKCSTDLAEIEKLIDGHILLLQSLKTSFLQESKKQLSIKFDGDEQSTPEKKTTTTQECDASIIERYKHNLDEAVHKLCAHYFESAERKQISNPILTPLITLLIEFESKNLFVALARQFDVDSAYKFFDKVLRTWLTGDTMRCKAVVDIVFLMMKHLSEDEQDASLDSFKQFPPSVVEWCLSVAVSHPHVRRRGPRAWLRGAAAAAALAALARRGVARCDAAAAALLLACLAEGADGEPLVSSEGVLQVVRTVTSAMSVVNDTLEYAGGLGARLVTSLAAMPKARPCHTEHFAKLVLELFKLNIVIPRGDSRLSLETWCEIRSSWQDGVAVLSDEARQHFLTNAGQLLLTEFFKEKNLNIQKIDHIVSLCPHLFNRSLGEGSDLPTDVTEIIKFTKEAYNLDDTEALPIETCALRHECVTSQLNCLYDDDNDTVKNIVTNSSAHDIVELSRTDLVLYVNKVLYRAIYLRTLLLHKACEEDDDDSEQQTWCDTLLSDQYIKEQFCKILYNYMVVQSLNEGYTFWPHYTLVQETYNKLSTLITDVVAATSPSLRDTIVTSLYELATSKGYYWAIAHRWYCNACDDERRKASGDELEKDMDVHKLEETISGNGLFHTLQADARFSRDEAAAYKTCYLVMLRSWNVAHSRLITEDFLRDIANCKDNCDLSVIANSYMKNQHTMLYEKDISDAPWSQVVSNVTVVEFLTFMVESKGWEIPAAHWDFTTIALCSLLSSVLKSKNNWGSVKVAMLTRSVLKLLAAVRSFISNYRSECERRQPSLHVAHLFKEWGEFFAPHINDNLYTLVIHILNTAETKSITVPQAQVLTSLIAAVPQLEWDMLPAARSSGDLSLDNLVRCPAVALQKPTHPAHKYLAYYLLENLSKVLVFDDSRKLTLWSADDQDEGDVEKQRPTFSLDLFHETFSHLQEIVDAALINIELGEEICELVAMSDSHSMTLSWLLLADAMALMCTLARGDLTQFYIQIYRECKYAPPLLTSSLRLLPGDVFAYASDSSGTAPAPADCSDMFLRVKPFDMNAALCGADVPALACRCVLTSLCGAGCGAARGWAGALRQREAKLLDRVVTAFVAPWAIKQQLKNLHMRANEIEDTEIQIVWSTNEVTCSLTVEESVIDLHVKLSRAHPLVPPKLSAEAGPGNNTHWLALYLAYQNGTLLNALKMWTRAVNARVEKSPHCYICYCHLHPTTGQLPRVLCHQCRNRFHNMCLRKWFLSSNKSNCPLCRANF